MIKELYAVALMAVRLYAVLDPVGLIPVYLTLAADMTREQRARVLKVASTVAAVLMSLFSLFGHGFIDVLGFEISSFKLSGGILLLILAVDELGWGPRTRSLESGEELAVVPLAIPLLVGPGTITMILMFLAEGYHPLQVLAASLVAALATYITLAASDRLMGLLGRSGALALSRFMAIILAAFAAEMIHSALVDWGIAR